MKHRSSLAVLALATGLFPAAAPLAAIFSDGFESGTVCAWSQVVGLAPQFVEAFPGSAGAPWPAGWSPVGGVALFDLQAGLGRFRPIPSGYSLARLTHGWPTHDVEATFTLVFEDVASQGVGFYVRQNGGYLVATNPTGQGYAVFVEGFRGTPGIGLWRELAGVESPLLIHFDSALGLTDEVPYRVRFRVEQLDLDTTRLSAKVWPVAGVEPGDWQVTIDDDTPELQGVTGGIAFDSWSSVVSPNPITEHTRVDDLELVTLCPFQP
jgi:hypothetical protein